MGKVLFAVILVISCAMPASAASSRELTPYLSGEYFTWQEYNSGKSILKESGPLIAGGLLYGVITPSSATVRGKTELFGGNIDYDGQTQSGTTVVETNVSYFGGRQEIDLGYRFNSGDLRLEPFAGVGYRWWLRDLHSSAVASGYTEFWQTGYGRFGARGNFKTPSGIVVHAEGGMKYPFYNGNSVDFTDVGVVTVQPGAMWSGFAEAGVTWRRLKISLFYEGFRFSQSSEVSVGTYNVLQPDSRSDIFGLSLGLAFR